MPPGLRINRDTRLLQRQDVPLDRARADLILRRQLPRRARPRRYRPQLLDQRVEPIGPVHDGKLPPATDIPGHPPGHRLSDDDLFTVACRLWMPGITGEPGPGDSAELCVLSPPVAGAPLARSCSHALKPATDPLARAVTPRPFGIWIFFFPNDRWRLPRATGGTYDEKETSVATDLAGAIVPGAAPIPS